LEVESLFSHEKAGPLAYQSLRYRLGDNKDAAAKADSRFGHG
jgi:hypothetical protein